MKRFLFVVLLGLLFATPSMAQSHGSDVKVLTYSKLKSLIDGSDSDRWLVGDRPIIIDFSATWCGPCQTFAPKFAQSAAKYRGKVDFYSVDIDQESELAEFFEIESIPTVIAIPVRGEIDTYVGAFGSSDQLNQAVEIVRYAY